MAEFSGESRPKHFASLIYLGSSPGNAICIWALVAMWPIKETPNNTSSRIDMLRIKLVIASIFSIVCANSLACDCNAVSLNLIQEQSYSRSQIIFVGDVLSANKEKGTYKINIVEIFKGDVKVTTLEGKQLSSCSGFPDKGRWIIYAESINNGVIDFSVCGLSRSFDEPQWSNIKEYQIPSPPKTNSTDSKHSIQADIDFRKTLIKIKERALTDLELEIAELRKRK